MQKFFELLHDVSPLVGIIRSSSRVSFSIYISRISQKFLNNGSVKKWTTNASLRLFPLLYRIIPKAPFYKWARKSEPTRNHGWTEATSFGTMLQIGKRILNGNKRCPIKGLCCNDNPIRKREGNCAWSLSTVRAHDCIRYRLWRTYRTYKRMPVITIIIVGHFAWAFSRVHRHFDVNAGIEKQKSDTLGSAWPQSSCRGRC